MSRGDKRDNAGIRLPPVCCWSESGTCLKSSGVAQHSSDNMAPLQRCHSSHVLEGAGASTGRSNLVCTRLVVVLPATQGHMQRSNARACTLPPVTSSQGKEKENETYGVFHAPRRSQSTARAQQGTSRQHHPLHTLFARVAAARLVDVGDTKPAHKSLVSISDQPCTIP